MLVRIIPWFLLLLSCKSVIHNTNASNVKEFDEQQFAEAKKWLALDVVIDEINDLKYFNEDDQPNPITDDAMTKAIAKMHKKIEERTHYLRNEMTLPNDQVKELLAHGLVVDKDGHEIAAKDYGKYERLMDPRSKQILLRADLNANYTYEEITDQFPDGGWRDPTFILGGLSTEGGGGSPLRGLSSDCESAYAHELGWDKYIQFPRFAWRQIPQADGSKAFSVTFERPEAPKMADVIAMQRLLPTLLQDRRIPQDIRDILNLVVGAPTMDRYLFDKRLTAASLLFVVDGNWDAHSNNLRLGANYVLYGVDEDEAFSGFPNFWEPDQIDETSKSLMAQMNFEQIINAAKKCHYPASDAMMLMRRLAVLQSLKVGPADKDHVETVFSIFYPNVDLAKKMATVAGFKFDDFWVSDQRKDQILSKLFAGHFKYKINTTNGGDQRDKLLGETEIAMKGSTLKFVLPAKPNFTEIYEGDTEEGLKARQQFEAQWTELAHDFNVDYIEVGMTPKDINYTLIDVKNKSWILIEPTANHMAFMSAKACRELCMLIETSDESSGGGNE